MRIVAYLYSDPLLEATPDPAIWGWEVDQVYQDLARSTATSDGQKGSRSTLTDIDRLQWQQLLRDCEVTPTDYLLVQRLEDLGASVQAVGDRLSELEALGVRLIVLESPSAEGLSGSGQAMVQGVDIRAEMLQFLQQIQRSQRSRCIRQGHARNRVKALPPPGKAPYGYRRGRTGYVIDRTTAPVVKEFFEQFLLFGSLRGAVRFLAKKYGKKIAVSTGQRWLTSPVYRGDLEYHNGEIVPDTHPALLSRDEAAQIDRLLRRNRRLPTRSATAPRSLAGLVVCGECQSGLTITRVTTAKVGRKAEKQAQEYLYLRSPTCPRKPRCRAIAYEAVLQATIERICVDLPAAVNGAPLPDMDGVKRGLEAAIAAKQRILEQLPALVSEGILDSETADLRAYKVRTEIAQLQAKLAQLPPINLKAIAQTVSIPQFWLDLSEAERRFYFREFIRQIELQRQGKSWQLKLVFIF